MPLFSLPYLGIFDFLTFGTLKQNFADKSREKDPASIVLHNSTEAEESPQIYLWSFFPLF